MKDGRSPRIHLSLSIWSALLIGLVLVEIRHLPPGLTVLLLPYLAVMARHWIGRLRQRSPIEPAISPADAAGCPSEDESDECADLIGPGCCSGYDDFDHRTSAPPAEERATPPTRRRIRRRSRSPEPDPTTASSWVQVRPGRFVRVDETPTEQPADESDSGRRIDEPHESPALDCPAVTTVVGSIPDHPDAAAAGFEPGVHDAEKDAAETVVPEDREIGDVPTTGALVTTSFLVGCRSGDPGDRDGSPPTSGARPEVEPDDRREDMLLTERPEMDLGSEEPVDLARRYE